MTEKDIIQHLASSIDDRRYPYQIPNAFIYKWECDYWIMDNYGVTKEFEIKCSRSDYKVDAKKEKHKRCDGANYFYYVCPKDLIKPEEVHPKYGLVYVWDTGYVEIKKKPRRLNNNAFAEWRMLANKMYWKWRTLWREKYIRNEITTKEFKAGFDITIEKTA